MIEHPATAPPGMPTERFLPRVWRTPLAIRISALLPAALIVILAGTVGVDGEVTVVGLVAILFFLLVPPYLALRPVVQLGDDGALLLREWGVSKRASVFELERLSIAPTGARFDFSDGTFFTSVIFYAPHSVKHPRVFEFVEAVTGERPEPESWDPHRLGGPDGIVVYRNPSIDRPLTEVPRPADDLQKDSGSIRAAQAIQVIETHARRAVGGRAKIRRYRVPDTSIHVLAVVPLNPGAASVDIVAEQFLIVTVGRGSARWELEYEDWDLTKAMQLIDDTVAGRVVERTAWARSTIRITHADGSRESATSYSGCLSVLIPLPGWRTVWGRKTVFESY